MILLKIIDGIIKTFMGGESEKLDLIFPELRKPEVREMRR